MANMRVHELAKELNITSKDITDMLSNSEKTYKSVSGLTDAEISSVRKKFAPAPKAENKPAAQPAKQSQPVKNDNRDNRQQNQTPKQPQQGTQNKSGNADDKKHISQVYFPQNSSRDKNPRRDNNNTAATEIMTVIMAVIEIMTVIITAVIETTTEVITVTEIMTVIITVVMATVITTAATGITTVITMAATVTVIIMVTEIMTVTMAAIETMTATTMAVMATVIIMAVTEIMTVTTMVVMVIVIIMAVIETMTATITAVSEMTETDSLEMAASERIMTRTVEDLTEVREEIMTEEILHLRKSLIFQLSQIQEDMIQE